MNSIDVTVYPKDATDPADKFEFEDVNFLSFVNHDTFGIPAKIAEDSTKREGLPVRILYVNPNNVAAVEADRSA